jgi:hypothetical protein
MHYTFFSRDISETRLQSRFGKKIKVYHFYHCTLPDDSLDDVGMDAWAHHQLTRAGL